MAINNKTHFNPDITGICKEAKGFSTSLSPIKTQRVVLNFVNSLKNEFTGQKKRAFGILNYS